MVRAVTCDTSIPVVYGARQATVRDVVCRITRAQPETVAAAVRRAGELAEQMRETVRLRSGGHESLAIPRFVRERLNGADAATDRRRAGEAAAILTVDRLTQLAEGQRATGRQTYRGPARRGGSLRPVRDAARAGVADPLRDPRAGGLCGRSRRPPSHRARGAAAVLADKR